MVATVEKSRLGALDELGAGGEGTVYRCAAFSDKVFKEFKSAILPEVDEDSLRLLVSFPATLASSDRSHLMSRTAWPTDLVTNRGGVVGYLMPLIPPEFFVTHGVKAYPATCECDWNKLAMRTTWLDNSNIHSTVPQAEGMPLIDVLLDLCRTVQLLHDAGFIIGDISGRNMLWRVQPSCAVLMIDNDGYRKVGTRGVTIPKQTPDWIDEYLGGAATTQESDLYKLSLAVLRGYLGSGVISPADVTTRDPAVSRLLELAKRGTGPSPRPSASEWLRLLTELRQQLVWAGRPVIAMPPVMSQPRLRVIESFVAARPIIKLG